MAIYNICKYLLKQNNDDLAYFLPTDHIIEKDNIFTHLDRIDHNKINLLGEKTAHACSNFGYLIKGKELSEKYFQIKRFIEKPENPNQLNGKDIYKNLGIYIAKPSCLYNEFHNLHPNGFPSNLSIDKMITEKSKNLNAFEVNFKWLDIGSISNLYKQFEDSIFSINNLDINDIKSFNKKSEEFEMNYDGTFLQITKKLSTRHKDY
jgi:mannose-1-phosphate guanylyltransferase